MSGEHDRTPDLAASTGAAEPALQPDQPAPETRSTTRERVTGATAFWIGSALLVLVVVFGVITPDHAFLRPRTC